VEQVAATTLPAGYSLAWTDRRSRSSAPARVDFRLLARAGHGVPDSGGAVRTLGLAGRGVAGGSVRAARRTARVLLRGFTNDIYFQIGLVVLIGLAAKNAILIVEFAAQNLGRG